MPNDISEPEDLFVFGILFRRMNDGQYKADIQSVNQNVPEEIIIMNLKALLKRLEQTFYDKSGLQQK